MSLFKPQFQIVSDLPLETPLVLPSYTTFKLDVQANNLCLLGDIGLVKDRGIFIFIENLLKSTPNLTIFNVFGNHESYQMDFDDAPNKMRHFVIETKRNYGQRLMLLHRDRYDVDRTVTILGCPLWSHIPPDRAAEAQDRLTDFNETRGIRGWSLERHNLEHQKDLHWLNQQVEAIQTTEPDRQIIILTHHSPTRDPRATDPKHISSSLACGFSTDLSAETCWTSTSVKMWAFGHTHFSFSFHDESTQKLVIAHQKGYSAMDDSHSSPLEVKVVEFFSARWDRVSIVEDAAAMEKRSSIREHKKSNCSCKPEGSAITPPKMSVIKRASQRISRHFQFRS